MKTKRRTLTLLSLVLGILLVIRQNPVQAAWFASLCPEDAHLLYFCDNFDDGNADEWVTEGGNWTATDGQFLVEGTSTRINRCGVDRNQALIQTVRAHNVDLELDMQSLVRVDKLLVLRAANSGNQIELNFRAERPGKFPSDLIVQEWANCQFTLHTPEFSVLIPPHQVGEVIHTRVRLTDQRLEVWIDGVLVLDQTFPFSNRTGKIGVTGIIFGITAFDNVEVSVIRP